MGAVRSTTSTLATPRGGRLLACRGGSRARRGDHSVRLLARWAFAGLGVVRLELTCVPDNVASLRVAERCGFVREGILRSHVPFKEGRRDTVIFGLLPDEISPTVDRVSLGTRTDDCFRVFGAFHSLLSDRFAVHYAIGAHRRA